VILFTTSRRPIQRVRSFVGELSHSIPKCIKLNRGKLSLEGVAERSLELNCDKALILERWMGGPGRIQLLQFKNSNLTPIPPLIYLVEVNLRREYGTLGRFQAEAITIRSEENSELVRLAKSLSSFFELPLNTLPPKGSYRVALHVMRHSKWKAKVVLASLPAIREIGPSLTIKHLRWQNFEGSEKS